MNNLTQSEEDYYNKVRDKHDMTPMSKSNCCNKPVESSRPNATTTGYCRLLQKVDCY